MWETSKYSYSRGANHQSDEQVKADRTVADTLQCGLTAYSGRSRGVVTSLLAFTVEEDQCGLDFSAWTEWFETTAFAVYVLRNGNRYQHLVQARYELTKLNWCDLIDALKSKFYRTSMLLDVSGDQDEAETRLKALVSDDTDHEDHGKQPSLAGYDTMCRRLRVLYLRIIVDYHRRTSEHFNSKTTQIFIIRKQNANVHDADMTLTPHVISP